MSTLPHDWTWMQAHATALLTAAGTVLLVLVLASVWLIARHRSLGRGMRAIAMPLVLAFEAQGLYVLILRLGAARDLALVLCGFSAAAIATFGSLAHEHYKKHQNLGPNGRVMWYVAVPVGLVVALSAGSLSGAGLRVLLSVLSVALFRSVYLPDEPAGKKAEQGSWRITPRRLAVRLGLIDPADTDLTTIHEERAIRLLTSHAAGYHGGFRPLRRWHGWRFGKLALTATDEMIDEARRRFRRAQTGLASTAPDAKAGGPGAPTAVATASAPDGPTAGPTETPTDPPPAIATAGPPAGPPVTAPDGPPAVGTESPTAAATGDGIPLSVIKVRRKGSAACSDDEIKEAIRDLRKTEPGITKYAVGKALRGSKGTVGPDRGGRLLAEVNAERPNLTVAK